jgi:hypothetical protein
MKLIGSKLEKRLRKERIIYVFATGKVTKVLCIFNITNVSLTKLEYTDTNHLYVSVSQFRKIKKLSELCLETIKIRKIPLTYVQKITYLRETDLLSTNNVTAYLMTEYGNETSSCKTKHG